MFIFTNPLKEGLILSRPNRFLMNVLIENEINLCHCPSTGSIGSIIFESIPCLVSESSNPKRKTKYTVEAISLDPINSISKRWIGINQSKINDYVNYFLKENYFKPMIDAIENVSREFSYHNSRFDFKINDSIFLEVKMPLQILNLPKDYNPITVQYKNIKFSTVDRLIKHLEDLTLYSHASENHKIIMLICFLYPSTEFGVENQSEKYKNVQNSVKNALSSGLEFWQANFEITPTSIQLINLIYITNHFI